jgi:nitrous oxidase accessory protein
MKVSGIISLLVALYLISLASGSTAWAQDAPMDLQAAIDAAQPGAVIQVPPGVYRGNFLIKKPVTLEGIDWPVLDGGDQGHVIEITEAPDVTIRGLNIRNSGARLDKENAGIAVDKSPRLVVENNRLGNTLFGIYIKSSDDSRIAHNVIGAKDLPVPARGDGIRVWYSRNTQVIGNQVDKGRDVVMWFNNGSVIRDNVITNGRYGLHFMYCDDNLVENNRSEGNSVGAFLMYSRRLTLRQNIFANNRGPSGYGVGLKDMDGVEATDNLFSGNRVGLYFDNSPWSIDVSQHFTHNAFVHNDIGLYFNPSVKRNHFGQNSFIDNLEQVGLTGRGSFEGNSFSIDGRGNFWSDYAGYDATGDGLGDLPYVSKSLFENIMDNNPELRLFQLSPAQGAVEMAARAFPIFQPQPKFTDDAPLMSPVIPTITPPSSGLVWPLWAISLTLLTLAVLTMAGGVFAASEGRRVTFQAHLPRKRRGTGGTGVNHHAPTDTGQLPMIKVTNLTKKFGDFTAVNNLSFEVASGEAVALWGPNGAGKTTVIRSLLGLYVAQGELQVNGWDISKDGKKARAVVGYVPQELAFYDDLSARHTLLFYARLKGVFAPRVEEVLAEVGLSDHGDKPVLALSGGMKQRLALAIALLADPPLLMLDEPTSNLDTTARDDFIKLLLGQKAGGKTLLLTSHRLEEIEILATRVLVLEDGGLKMICDSPTELADQLGMQIGLKLVIPQAMRDNALKLLQAGGYDAASNGTGLRVTVSPSAKTAPIRTLLDADIEVDDFEVDNGF